MIKRGIVSLVFVFGMIVLSLGFVGAQCTDTDSADGWDEGNAVSILFSGGTGTCASLSECLLEDMGEWQYDYCSADKLKIYERYCGTGINGQQYTTNSITCASKYSTRPYCYDPSGDSPDLAARCVSCDDSDNSVLAIPGNIAMNVAGYGERCDGNSCELRVDTCIDGDTIREYGCGSAGLTSMTADCDAVYGAGYDLCVNEIISTPNGQKTSAKCMKCGALTESCCSGNICLEGSCISGTCVSSGPTYDCTATGDYPNANAGQFSCVDNKVRECKSTGNWQISPPNGDCSSYDGKIARCDDEGNLFSSALAASADCRDNSSCGNTGQPCCDGTFCRSDSCVGGTCGGSATSDCSYPDADFGDYACRSGAVYVCTSPDGWSLWQNCPSGSCDASNTYFGNPSSALAECSDVCTSECSALDERRCSGTMHQRCQYSGECLVWVDFQNCVPPTTCVLDPNVRCTGCTNGAECNDGNECTQDVCNGGSCENPNVADGTACNDCPGTPGNCNGCLGGTCRDGALPGSCSIVSENLKWIYLGKEVFNVVEDLEVTAVIEAGADCANEGINSWEILDEDRNQIVLIGDKNLDGDGDKKYVWDTEIGNNYYFEFNQGGSTFDSPRLNVSERCYFKEDGGFIELCADYGDYPGGLEDKKDACISDCAGVGVSAGGYCQWDDLDEECFFAYDSSSADGYYCRINYGELGECGADDSFRTVTTTTTKRDESTGLEINDGSTDCVGSCGESVCDIDSPCPKVIQLPFLTFWNVVEIVVILIVVYVFWIRKKNGKAKVK